MEEINTYVVAHRLRVLKKYVSARTRINTQLLSTAGMLASRGESLTPETVSRYSIRFIYHHLLSHTLKLKRFGRLPHFICGTSATTRDASINVRRHAMVLIFIVCVRVSAHSRTER